VLRDGLAMDLRREQFLAARISTALRGELSGIVSDAARLEGGQRLGYSAYATSSNETCPNQLDSMLQIAFSSPSAPGVISANLAGNASEKASDATECRVFERTLGNL